VIRDEVNFSNNWDVAERWQVFFRADWSLRQTVDDATSFFRVAVADDLGGPGVQYGRYDSIAVVQGGNDEIDTMRWGVAGRLTHLLTRNTSAWVQLTYNEQDSQSRTLGNTSDFENFLGSVGIRHVFEPIKLW
jgi:hypothetical protein